MIEAEHLRDDVITPVLKQMGCFSEDAVELLLLTAAQETHCGRYLHQLNGPAIGIYQMEPDTYEDVWNNYLKYKKHLAEKIRKWQLPLVYKDRRWQGMAGNMYYATAMARAFYLRFPKAIPSKDDREALAGYYKKFWNTELGAATIAEAVKNYERFVA